MSDEILVGWNGDGRAHTATLKVVYSNGFQDVQRVSFESCCDSLFIDMRFVRVSATMGSSYSSIDFMYRNFNIPIGAKPLTCF